jgi:hypothetical protein
MILQEACLEMLNVHTANKEYMIIKSHLRIVIIVCIHPVWKKYLKNRRTSVLSAKPYCLLGMKQRSIQKRRRRKKRVSQGQGLSAIFKILVRGRQEQVVKQDKLSWEWTGWLLVGMEDCQWTPERNLPVIIILQGLQNRIGLR